MEVENILKEDPLEYNQLAFYEIIEFEPTSYIDDFTKKYKQSGSDDLINYVGV